MSPQRVPAPIRHLRRRRVDVDPEAGLETVEILTWTAVSVVIIVAIGALLQLLGADVIGFVRDQIGIE